MCICAGETERQTDRQKASALWYGSTEYQALIFCGLRLLIFVCLIKHNICPVHVVVLFLMLIVFIRQNCQSQHCFIIVSDHLARDVPFFVPKGIYHHLSDNVPLAVELIYFVFTRISGDSYCRRFRFIASKYHIVLNVHRNHKAY